MNNSKLINSRRLTKRAYQAPEVKKLGRVQQLTLKLGSLTDGQNPGHFQ